MTKKFSNFVQRQAALNNISDTLKQLYIDDELFNTPEAFAALTERTMEVMEHTDSYEAQLASDPNIINTAKKLMMPVEEVVVDISFVMLYSTIAKQSIIIEQLTNRLEELDG